MIKRINCNSCGITLEVPQRNGEQFREIHCPNCSHYLRVTFGDPQVVDNSETVYGGMQGVSSQASADDDALTQLSQTYSERPGALRCGQDVYPLNLGWNLIGRKSKSSNASIQIPTDDYQMSREHAVINIVKIADGSIRTLIRNYKEHVITMVSGMLLETDDEVVLTNGTELMLGHTIITYIEE